MTQPTLKPLTDRAPSGAFEMPVDGWQQICPLGEFPHEKTGIIQVIDEKAIQSMANAFHPGDELLIDFDHESHSGDKRTTASGWLQNLVARADGLWCRIRWSKAGAQAVAGGEYRFLSPVWLASDCESLGNKRVRPLRLHDAGLTNKPNLRGLAPLSNREHEPEPESFQTGESALAPADEFMNSVREIAATREWTFERAWHAASHEHSDLYENALRDQPASIAERIRPSFTHPGGINPYVKFKGIVDRHAAVHRVTFERAYDASKILHPNEYNQMIAEHERDQRIAENSRSNTL